MCDCHRTARSHGMDSRPKGRRKIKTADTRYLVAYATSRRQTVGLVRKCVDRASQVLTLIVVSPLGKRVGNDSIWREKCKLQQSRREFRERSNKA